MNIKPLLSCHKISSVKKFLYFCTFLFFDSEGLDVNTSKRFFVNTTHPWYLLAFLLYFESIEKFIHFLGVKKAAAQDVPPSLLFIFAKNCHHDCHILQIWKLLLAWLLSAGNKVISFLIFVSNDANQEWVTIKFCRLISGFVVNMWTTLITVTIFVPFSKSRFLFNFNNFRVR